MSSKSIKSFLLDASIVCGFATCTLFLIGCHSYVYAPAAQIPSRQLLKGEADVKGGIGKFPETRTQNNRTTNSAAISIAYGFTKSLNLQVSGWADLTTPKQLYRGGMAASSSILLWDATSFRFSMIPKVAILRNDGKKFDAMAFELPLICTVDLPRSFYLYIGVGGAYGNRRLLTKSASEQEEAYAYIGYAGIGYTFQNSLRMMFEVNPIYLQNRYESQNNFILSPTLGVGYVINKMEQRGKYKSK